MSKKLFMALSIIISLSSYIVAETITLRNEDVKDGELVEKYTEEYIDLKEAEKLGVKVEEITEDKIQNHKKLEKPKILEKN